MSKPEATARRTRINMSQLHLDDTGAGVPAIFVHGSFSWGLDTFPAQVDLADQYRVILVDRRGFGGSRSLDVGGWPVDMQDLAALLEELGAAHVVGQSYGAVVALLAAGLKPERVLSLVVIEPPAYDLARGDPDADATSAALKPVFDGADRLSAPEFVEAWATATGMTYERRAAWTEAFGDQDWDAAEASRRERWPGDAPIDLHALGIATFPKIVVRGAWKPEGSGRQDGGRDFAAICQVLSKRIGARSVVFDRSSHNPQLQEPEAFNQLLREVWGQQA
jgi:pimeloyl-ACP methyl ester carboxylesterase